MAQIAQEPKHAVIFWFIKSGGEGGGRESCPGLGMSGFEKNTITGYSKNTVIETSEKPVMMINAKKTFYEHIYSIR